MEWLVAIGAGLLAVVAAMFGGKKWGQADERRKAAELGQRQAKKANAIDDGTAARSDADLDNRLRKDQR
jgi:hypothetical protein